MEENRCRARSVIGEVEKSVVGKTDILRKVMTAILAGGHVLIEDIPVSYTHLFLLIRISEKN